MQQLAAFLHWFISISPAFAQPFPASPGSLPRPTECTDIPCVATAIIGFLVTIAYSVIVIMALWGGILFMTAGGNEKRAEAGKKTLLYAVIGFAIVLVSQGVASIVQSFLKP